MPRPSAGLACRGSGDALAPRLSTAIGSVTGWGKARLASTGRTAVGDEENLVRDVWALWPSHKAANSGQPERVTDANDFAELLQPPVSMAAKEHNPTKAIAEEKERGGIR